MDNFSEQVFSSYLRTYKIFPIVSTNCFFFMVRLAPCFSSVFIVFLIARSPLKNIMDLTYHILTVCNSDSDTCVIVEWL